MSRQLEINGVSWCSCEFNTSCWFWGLAFRSVVLDTDHQFFSQKKEKKILMYSISKHQFCVCNPLVLHEKSVSVPSSNHPCKARTPAHLTGIIVEKHTGPAACSCPSRAPASYSSLEDKMFSCGPKAQTHFPLWGPRDQPAHTKPLSPIPKGWERHMG